jgi:hypothetical protein
MIEYDVRQGSDRLKTGGSQQHIASGVELRTGSWFKYSVAQSVFSCVRRHSLWRAAAQL